MIWTKHYSRYLLGFIIIIIMVLISTRDPNNLTDVFHGTFISEDSSDVSISIDSKNTNTFTLYAFDEYGRQSSKEGTVKHLSSNKYMIDCPEFRNTVVEYENLKFTLVLEGKPVAFTKFHNSPIIIENKTSSPIKGALIGSHPTQSYKSTTSDFMHVTVPLISKSIDLKSLVFSHLITNTNEMLPISSVDYLDPTQDENGLYTIMTTFNVAHPLDSGKEYTLVGVVCTEKNLKKTIPINVHYFKESEYEPPFLIGSFVTDNASSKLTYEMKNITSKSITITDIDCGPDISIERRSLVTEGQVKLISGPITIKPNETIKQEILFSRDSKCFSEITLQHHTNDIKGTDRFSIFSFTFSGESNNDDMNSVIQ